MSMLLQTNLHKSEMIIYKLLCIFRVIFVFLPQIGYIHPDEHFQGPEIVYGDILEFDVFRAWEFTSSNPIRSIVFPYTVIGIPAAIICLLSSLQYNSSIYLLLILPRLMMCALSFLQDVCIYKVCVTMNINPKQCLTFFASSYVTLIYMTRTFSNSLESAYFSFLIFIVCQVWKLHKELSSKGTSSLYLRKYTFFSFLYGIILSLGFFNRPTFVCFSVIPTIVWFYMCLKVNIYTKMNVFAAFFLGVFSISTCLVAIDSFYYNKINYSSTYNINNIICTPFNFILYNLNSENLNSHGLHPRWYHSCVNVPLLFSIYGIALEFYALKKFINFIKKMQLSLELLLILSFLIPLFMLSLIPHQEPRFIIPVIIPLSLLLESTDLRSYRSFTYFWIISNVLSFVFYGFLHQSGIYLSMQYIRNKINNDSAVIFYKTYMPPRYFLSLKNHQNISVFDFAGYEESLFQLQIQDIAIKYKPSKLFTVLPNEILISNTKNISLINYKLSERTHLFPHLSTENLPQFKDIQHILEKKSSHLSKLLDLKKIFSIQILIFELA